MLFRSIRWVEAAAGTAGQENTTTVDISNKHGVVSVWLLLPDARGWRTTPPRPPSADDHIPCNDAACYGGRPSCRQQPVVQRPMVARREVQRLSAPAGWAEAGLARIAPKLREGRQSSGFSQRATGRPGD